MWIKKAKDTKTFVIKWNLKFEECKNCLQDTQLENKVDMISFREIHNKFIKSNESIIKSQQRFWSKNHNVFNEKVSKKTLSA